tara:strand:- start:57 stop:788 length:732 start_codon:yes stop_codon:yes gene_type:complete
MCWKLDIIKDKDGDLIRPSIFLGLPKTGGNAMTDYLKNFNPRRIGASYGHHTYQNLINLESEVVEGREMNRKVYGIEEAHYFVTVRNPWDRMVSFWSYSRNSGTNLGKRYTQFMTKLANGLSFSDFVNIVCKERPIENEDNDNDLFRPQMDYLVNDKNEVVIGDVLMLEDVKVNTDKMLKKYISEETLNTLTGEDFNVINKSDHLPYMEYYNEDLIDMVYEYEKEIIDLMGYTFESHKQPILN